MGMCRHHLRRSKCGLLQLPIQLLGQSHEWECRLQLPKELCNVLMTFNFNSTRWSVLIACSIMNRDNISPTVRGLTVELARWNPMSHGAHHCSAFALTVGVTVSSGQFFITFIGCGNSWFNLNSPGEVSGLPVRISWCVNLEQIHR